MATTKIPVWIRSEYVTIVSPPFIKIRGQEAPLIKSGELTACRLSVAPSNRIPYGLTKRKGYLCYSLAYPQKCDIMSQLQKGCYQAALFLYAQVRHYVVVRKGLLPGNLFLMRLSATLCRSCREAASWRLLPHALKCDIMS